MSCHVRGMIPRADQVREHVEKNPRAFPEKSGLLALYPPREGARNRARITRMTRIHADRIRANPPDPRHPRSGADGVRPGTRPVKKVQAPARATGHYLLAQPVGGNGGWRRQAYAR